MHGVKGKRNGTEIALALLAPLRREATGEHEPILFTAPRCKIRKRQKRYAPGVKRKRVLGALCGFAPGDQRRAALVAALFAATLFIAAPAVAIKVTSFEAALRGFPVLRDQSGRKLADGDFAQWIDGERLHVKLTYQFSDRRRAEERAEFRQGRELVQEKWSWRELDDGQLFRHFLVDLRTGQAIAEKREDQELKHWSEEVAVEPGRTFVGIGLTLAIKNLRERFIEGEKIDLKAVGFTPKPRVVTVEISHAGLDQMRMSDRTLQGDRFVIHPKIPWIAELFIEVPDTHIWLVSTVPAGFLRMEGPLVEPSDSIVRIDLLPGGESGPAKPISEKAKRHSRTRD